MIEIDQLIKESNKRKIDGIMISSVDTRWASFIKMCLKINQKLLNTM